MNEEDIRTDCLEREKEIVSLIVSHNTRIQCLVDLIQEEKQVKVRFMNCAILKLELTNECFKLSLIYQGELDKSDYVREQYYIVGPSSDAKYVEFIPYTSQSLHMISVLKLPAVGKIYNNKKYTFYIVTSGQSQPNSSKNFFTSNAKLDTITQIGESQSINAGRALRHYLNQQLLFNFIKYLDSKLITLLKKKILLRLTFSAKLLYERDIAEREAKQFRFDQESNFNKIFSTLKA